MERKLSVPESDSNSGSFPSWPALLRKSFAFPKPQLSSYKQDYISSSCLEGWESLRKHKTDYMAYCWCLTYVCSHADLWDRWSLALAPTSELIWVPILLTLVSSCTQHGDNSYPTLVSFVRIQWDGVNETCKLTELKCGNNSYLYKGLTLPEPVLITLWALSC